MLEIREIVCRRHGKRNIHQNGCDQSTRQVCREIIDRADGSFDDKDSFTADWEAVPAADLLFGIDVGNGAHTGEHRHRKAGKRSGDPTGRKDIVRHGIPVVIAGIAVVFVKHHHARQNDGKEHDDEIQGEMLPVVFQGKAEKRLV